MRVSLAQPNTALAKGIAALQTKPVLHGNNGSTLKVTMVLAMLNWLGVKSPVLQLELDKSTQNGRNSNQAGQPAN